MREALDNAKSELRRVDHLIYVSLKYTRTVDVFKSIIDRLINAYDFGMESLLKYLKSKKRINDFPKSPIAKAELLKKIYKDDQKIYNALEEYALLRKINKAEYTRAKEYRRHVTMTVIVDGEVIEINIDKMHELFENIKEFVSYVEEIIAI